MPIAPAIIAAGIGAAGTAYASSQANKAAKQQIAAQQSADQRNYELQQQALQQSQQNNQPFMQAGYGALSQLASQFGLGGAVPSSSGGGATPSGSNYDVSAYISQNPDVAQRAQELQQQGVIGPNGQWKTAEDWVGQVQLPNAVAAGEQRNYPTVGGTPQQTPQTGTGANYGPQVGERATYTRPDVGSAPSLPSLTAENYRASPGYENRLKQAGRATNAQFAARGILQSGAAAEEFGKRMQNIADEDYNDWVGQQLGLYDRSINQYNQDRNRLDTNFAQDRAYGTGVYDADRNYLTSRFDQNVSDLFNLAGIGQSAAARQGSAQSQYAANVGNQANQSANTLSGIYGNQASNNATAMNNILGIGQNLVSNWGNWPKSGTPTTTNSGYNWSPDWGGGS